MRSTNSSCRVSLLLAGLLVATAAHAQGPAGPPQPEYGSLHMTPMPGEVAGPECGRATEYELLPQRRAMILDVIRSRTRGALSGTYGRLEYLHVDLDDGGVRFGSLVDGFHPRSTFGAVFNDQPAEDLLSLPVISPDFGGFEDLNGFTLNQDFERGEDQFFIDNVRRGRERDQIGEIPSGPVILSEPRLGQANLIRSGFNVENSNGIRGLVGRPWEYGLIEADVWGIEQTDARDSFTFFNNAARGFGINPRLDDDPTNDLDAAGLSDSNNDLSFREFVAIPLIYTDPIAANPAVAVPDILDLPNGAEVEAPRQGILLFDNSFQTELDTELFGAGGTVLWHLRPDDRWRLLALTGFRFTRLEDRLRTSASVSPELNNILGGPSDARVARIDADTRNDLYMAQLGFRTEMDLGPVTLGVQPQVGLGGINRTAETFSENLNFNSVATRDELDSSDFAATFNLSVYSSVQFNSWFSLRFGYEVTALSDVFRPDSVLDYRTVSSAPAITARDQTDDMQWDRFFIGGEVLLP